LDAAEISGDSPNIHVARIFFNLGERNANSFFGATVNYNVRAFMGHSIRNRQANTCGRAANERYLAAQL